MDFELDKNNTKVEQESCCEAKSRLQDESLSCLNMDLGKSAKDSEALPGMKLTDAKEEANDLPEMEMARRRNFYPASYPHKVPAEFSRVGARYDVHGGKVVIRR